MRDGSSIAGIGYAVPDTIVPNGPIAARLGVDEAWIERRTGTRERRVMAPGERLSDLAAAAGRTALAGAGIAAGELDMLLVATTSPDEMSPHAAPLVAGALGAGRAAAIDVSAACTGFLSALALAASMLDAGRARHILVIGADALSRYLDPDDRGSAMLFGDGAGAIVLATGGDGACVGPVALHADPSESGLIRLDRHDGHIRMDGPAVYRVAVRRLVEVTREAVGAAGLELGDIDLFVYHQANSRILRAVGERLGLPEERVIDVVPRFANTSAATLPIALAVAAEEGRLRDGARLLLATFGAGLVWGGAVVRWGQAASDASAATAGSARLPS